MDKSGGGAAPTGCYKCGRPGHWSRDCPSDPSTTNNNNEDLESNPNGSANYSNKNFNSWKNSTPKSAPEAEKPKTLRKPRPTLTPDLLLSNDGIGHILRHFPRAFKYRGRGHEVSDLGNLLGMYAEWHSHLLPYYSFDHFVHKVEQVGAKVRVKKCLRELQERVASGVDPAKLHESQNQEGISNHDEVREAVALEMQNTQEEVAFMQNPDTDIHEESNFDDIFGNAMEDSLEPANYHIAPANVSSVNNEPPNKKITGAAMTEEQRARMIASRLKALEKAAARAQKLQGT
ncbi:OLC1v1033194C1 [Oldenlandia corymbosa var. corymbosa]|uniref:OLC1v1033194C1 n=1 Tax=Oldenlandia corymbosa var. corymbosa TaxID=529605 RepID=A0AAV1CPI5_OLDCO|nr:OLC1v1033194C1 [Oldenlandia corymbosa var. corymbosa]